MVNPGKSNLPNYKTVCYQRQGDKLLSPENCTVTIEFEHPENSFTWEIVALNGQRHHYRHRGRGIELWSNLTQQWFKVDKVDWFPGKEKMLS